jgi:hypothetical protein
VVVPEPETTLEEPVTEPVVTPDEVNKQDMVKTESRILQSEIVE